VSPVRSARLDISLCSPAHECALSSSAKRSTSVRASFWRSRAARTSTHTWLVSIASSSENREQRLSSAHGQCAPPRRSPVSVPCIETNLQVDSDTPEATGSLSCQSARVGLAPRAEREADSPQVAPGCSGTWPQRLPGSGAKAREPEHMFVHPQRTGDGRPVDPAVENLAVRAPPGSLPDRGDSRLDLSAAQDARILMVRTHLVRSKRDRGESSRPRNRAKW
jgi:hypothetical protein